MAGRINLKLRAHFFNKIGQTRTFDALVRRGWIPGSRKIPKPTAKWAKCWRAKVTCEPAHSGPRRRRRNSRIRNHYALKPKLM